MGRLSQESRRRRPFRNKSDAAHRRRRRSLRDGRRNLRHHAESVWGIQRSSNYLADSFFTCCHPERSEGSGFFALLANAQIPRRFASRNDNGIGVSSDVTQPPILAALL